MLDYYEGTIFNVSADALVNTVNCDGFMGAGIALEFMLRYPKMNIQYVEECKIGKYRPGKVYYYSEDNTTIINFPTKLSFKYPSKIEWIEQGLKNFAETYTEYDFKRVAFPKLGTSNGGLNWENVKELMEKYLSNIKVDVIVCLDEMKQAEGIEKKMLELFNNASIEYLSEITKLNINQKNTITSKRPFDRFWKISKTETIGKTTYKNVFTHFYSLAKNNNGIAEQISMFD